MTMTALLLFNDDEVGIAVDEILMFRALEVGDLDPKTGVVLKHIPEGKRTRIDLRSGGYVWVTEEWSVVAARLLQLPEEVRR